MSTPILQINYMQLSHCVYQTACSLIYNANQSLYDVSSTANWNLADEATVLNISGKFDHRRLASNSFETTQGAQCLWL